MAVDEEQYRKDKENIHNRINILETELSKRFDTLDNSLGSVEEQIKRLRKMIHKLEGSQDTQESWISHINGNNKERDRTNKTAIGEVKGMTSAILSIVISCAINIAFMVALLKILGII